MLKNTIASSFGFVCALFGAAVVLAPGCGGGEGNAGECTPNQQISCGCTNGNNGIQVCNADGTAYGPCQCGDGGSSGSTASNSGGSTGGTTGTTKTGACGDGVCDPGEDQVGEFSCPMDCTGTGGAGGTTTNTCSGFVTYAGMVTGVPSAWGNHMSAAGATGYEAGINICQTIGGDHPCEYQEVLAAQAAGELANVAMGTTAWVHRTTVAQVNGSDSMPGPGGRCNDWVYTTNHISDGEYITFDQVGVPTYHLDNDTVYNVNEPGVHTIVGDLDCGGMMRAVLCCFPACM